MHHPISREFFGEIVSNNSWSWLFSSVDGSPPKMSSPTPRSPPSGVRNSYEMRLRYSPFERSRMVSRSLASASFTSARGYRLLQAFILMPHSSLQVVQVEMRFDARVNFLELEGLGYVVHRAGPESLYLVLSFVQSAKEMIGILESSPVDLSRSHTS